MNRYKLSKAGIDVKEGMERFNGNKELYEKFLMQFPQNEYFEKLKKAVEKKDANESFQAAHALKGVAGNLSMNQLYEKVVPLVEQLRGGEFGNAQELFALVKEQYEQTVSIIEESKK